MLHLTARDGVRGGGACGACVRGGDACGVRGDVCGGDACARHPSHHHRDGLGQPEHHYLAVAACHGDGARGDVCGGGDACARHPSHHHRDGLAPYESYDDACDGAHVCGDYHPHHPQRDGPGTEGRQIDQGIHRGVHLVVRRQNYPGHHEDGDGGGDDDAKGAAAVGHRTGRAGRTGVPHHPARQSTVVAAAAPGNHHIPGQPQMPSKA